MMMRIENILHGLLRDFPDIPQQQVRTAWEIGIHHNEVVLHLDHHIVAVALVLHISLAEPDARSRLLHRVRFGVRLSHRQAQRRQPGKHTRPHSPLSHIPASFRKESYTEGRKGCNW